MFLLVFSLFFILLLYFIIDIVILWFSILTFLRILNHFNLKCFIWTAIWWLSYFLRFFTFQFIFFTKFLIIITKFEFLLLVLTSTILTFIFISIFHLFQALVFGFYSFFAILQCKLIKILVTFIFTFPYKLIYNIIFIIIFVILDNFFLFIRLRQ